MATKQPVSNKSSNSSNPPSLDQKQKASQFFQELNKFLAVRDYRQVLKVTNKILHTDGFRTNFKLAKCKCSALIKMGRYDEIPKFLNSLPEDLASQLAFEEAYALYRLFKNKEAMVALNKSRIDNEADMTKVNDLRAQILYRLEDFNEAKDLYKKLLREGTDDFEEDRENNLLACEAAMSVKNSKSENSNSATLKKVKVSKLSVDTPDAFFNRAIVHIGNKDFVKAEKSLNNAKAVLESYDDLDAEELEQDLQPILIQLALVNQELGNTKVALKMYQNILKSGNTDLLTTSIINNNILAVNQTHNLFDSKKKSKALQTKNPELVKKLQASQIFVMELNKILVNVHSGGPSLVEARKLLEDLNIDPAFRNCTDLILAEAALLMKEEKIKEAVEFLKAKISQPGAAGPGQNCHSDKLNLALAQIKFNEADFSNFSTSPAILALKLANCENSVQQQLEILSAAEPNWTENVEFSKIYGEKLLLAKDFQKAFKIYKFLSENNDKFLPKFIQIASKIDPEASKLAADKLESTDSLIAGIDVNVLEETAGVAGSRYARKIKEAAAAAEKGAGQSGDNEKAKSKKKRKRKPKLPKNLDKEIDSERWKPLKDRSYYRGKKAYKNKRSGKMVGAQGSANYGKETMILDASKDNFKANNPSPGGGSSNKKKKGKKGKRR